MRKYLRRCALAAALLAAFSAYAEHTHFWRQSRYAEFEKGTATGVAIRSDGRLSPAPAFAQFADPNLAYLWGIAMDGQGRIYAAGGPNARVLRYDSGGKSTTVFESTELAAQAIVLDSGGNLYVATSPDGKIYRVAADGQRSVFFEPKTKYIWALALDAEGNLFAATGDDGKVFVISPKGEGKVFCTIHDRNARSLLVDAQGDLVIGTDPGGLVIREKMQKGNGGAEANLPKAGPSFVVYETGQREVTSLQQQGDDIIAAASAEKAGGPPTASAPAATRAASPPAGSKSAASISTAVPAVSPAPSTAPAGPSRIYRIPVMEGAGNGPQQIWESSDRSVYALLKMADGGILAGTGNDGVILRLDGREYYTRLQKTSSQQVTAFVQAPDGKIYAAGSNPGKIFALGPKMAANGTFLSEVFDAKYFSQWGRISWWGANDAGGVDFYVRSGNTSNPEHDWSEWVGPFENPQAETAAPPPSRFAQWKAVFKNPGGGGPEPSISWVNVAYQPRNIAPVIDDIVIQKPGIRLGSLAAAAAPGEMQPVQLELPGARVLAEQKAPLRVEAPPQGFRERGYQGVIWSAHDDNDDELTYAVYYRGEGETNWRLLKDKLTESSYSWDSTSMPDGAYYLKITVSDAKSNPPGDALTAERESSRFVVANGPPQIQDLHASAEGNGSAIVTFTARTPGAILSRAQYSVDAGDWELAYPASGITDSATESYRVELTGLAPGRHTVGVRVYDRFENVSTAQAGFTEAETHGKQ